MLDSVRLQAVKTKNINNSCRGRNGGRTVSSGRGGEGDVVLELATERERAIVTFQGAEESEC